MRTIYSYRQMKIAVFLKPLLANILRGNVRMPIFRPEIFRREASLPHQLAQEVIPYVDVRAVRRARSGFGQVYRPFVVRYSATADWVSENPTLVIPPL